MKLRVEAGTLGTLSCRMITISDRGEPQHWDHEVEEALEELEEEQPAGGDARAVVIRGPGMMQIPECWSLTACRLSQVAGHLGIFIGLEQGSGTGTAVCIHPGDTAAAVGDSFPYARPKPDTPAGRKEADWDKELRRRADRIWEGLNPRNRWRNEHQVLVCKRQSTIDRVLELVGDNIEKGTEAGIPLRAVLVDGPTGGWKGMRGFWLAVLNALGNRTERGTSTSWRSRRRRSTRSASTGPGSRRRAGRSWS